MVAVLLAVLLHPVAQAQSRAAPAVRRPVYETRVTSPSASGHLLALGANLLVSGLTAGVLRRHGGGSFLGGFTRGLAGGATIYAGKVLVVREGSAAPFVGRQLASAGASVVRNAGAGEGLLEHLTLPVGPLHLHIATSGPERSARLSLDLLGLAGLVGVLLAYDAEVDWAATLATAAPVLRVADPHDRLPWNGRQLAGTLLIRDDRRSERPVAEGATLAHELVHLVQYDQLALSWSEPAERALFRRCRWLCDVWPCLDLGLNAGLNLALDFLHPRSNPIELEAEFLGSTR